MEKLKVLMLGYSDSTLPGHIKYFYLRRPDFVEAQMVTLVGCEKKEEYSLHTQLKRPTWIRIQALFEQLYRWIYCLIHFHCFPVVDKKHKEYCFYDFEFYPYSAKDILKKCPKGFVPDIISIHWHQGFINSKLVRQLYELTGAKIVYHFVDEAPMTGGCHYPTDCIGYLNNCENCPALLHGKRLASIQLANKKKNLSGLPLYINGSPYDMKLAANTALFKNSVKFPSVRLPKVDSEKRTVVREQFEIDQSAFVVFVGASYLDDTRKGIRYSIEALKAAAQSIPNLFVLAAGRASLEIPGVTIKQLGYVSLNQLMNCFSAADCFLSTTIADSGPMMVNYSMAIGTPVVSFPIGIADSLVIHKETGYLARYKDSGDVAQGLLYLSELDEEARLCMSQKCVSVIKEKASTGSWIERIRTYEN